MKYKKEHHDDGSTTRALSWSRTELVIGLVLIGGTILIKKLRRR